MAANAHVTFDPESLLGSLMTNVPGAVYRCEVDADWTMLGIGDDIERITGYPASDFIASAAPQLQLDHPSRGSRARACRVQQGDRGGSPVRARVPRGARAAAAGGGSWTAG